MDYKHVWELMEVKHLRKIIREYNLHLKIARYSKLDKKELIEHMKNYLHINDRGEVKIREFITDKANQAINKVHETMKKPKVPKAPKAPKAPKEPKPKPEPKPKKITPKKGAKLPSPKKESPKLPSPKKEEDLNKKIRERLEELKKKGLNKIVDYSSSSTSSLLFQLAFIKKHKYDCIMSFPSSKGGDISSLQLYLPRKGRVTKKWDKTVPSEAAKIVYDKIIKCLENDSKVIIIPLSLRLSPTSGHANLLIYKPVINTIYRFEPHGEALHTERGQKQDDDINDLLKNIFEDKIFDKIKIKYVPPSETCPIIPESIRRGFQGMENQYLYSLSGQEQRSLEKKESGGFCQAWGFFLADLFMINPKNTIQELYSIAHKELKNDPKTFREVIRGFILDVEDELLKFVKEFKLGKRTRDIEDKLKLYYEQEIKKLVEEQKEKAKERHQQKLKELKKQFEIDTDDEEPKKASPKKASPKKNMKVERDIKKVLENWKDDLLGYVMDSNDYHGGTGEKITNLINKKNEQNKPVFDIFLLGLTKDYNNDVVNKYGVEELFNGINKLADHYGAETYLEAVSDPKVGFELPKGYLNVKNSKKVFDYVLKLNPNKFKNKL